MSGWVSDPQRADRLIELSDLWLEASIEQARQEGHFYPAFFAISTQDDIISDWESRRVLSSFSEDFSAWGDQCRRLAAAHDLDVYLEISGS